MLRVYIEPTFRGEDRADGGIRRLSDALWKYLPGCGVEPMDRADDAEIINNHGTSLTERPGVPTVSSCHGLMWSEYNWPNWANGINRAVKESLMRSDAQTCPSRWVRNAVTRGLLIDPVVIPHGVDIPEVIEESSGYVLWAKARADPVSDPAAVDKLAALLPLVPFLSTFAGNASNMRTLGKVPYPEMLSLTRRAGVYLATARETFGIGTLEALAAGVPVAGFRWGGQTEIIIEGETGYLAPPEDYAALAECVVKCFQERARLGANARQDAIERWQWPDKVGRYAKLFKETYRRATDHRPKVSVIVTYHNLGKYLEDCIRSVISQGMGDWELILVDDASDPEQAEIARRAATLDARIYHVRSDENLKLSRARNLGVAKSRGKYVLPLDADDMLAPNALATLSEALDKNRGTHIAYGHLDLVDESRGDGRRNSWPFEQYSWVGQLSHLNQLPYSAMIRREALEQSGGYRARDWRAEDASMWCRLTSLGYRARKVTEASTLVYRMRSDSKSQGEPGDGDWTAWFPWRLTRGMPGSLIPWGAQGEPSQVGDRRDFWPVPHQENPTVSVVIPVGPGHKGYVVDALDSLVAQTYPRWEAVVVNDTGEPWGDADTWDSPVQGFPWARVVETNKRGVSAARNLGVASSKADLIVFLDADDALLPHYLEKCLDAHAKDGGLVYTDWVRTKPDPSAANGQALEEHRAGDFACGAVLDQMQHGMTVLMPKRAIMEAGGFDERFQGWEDWDFLISVQAAGWCSTRVKEPLFIYRFHSGSLRELGFSRHGEIIKAIKGKWLDYYEGRKTLMACGGCKRARAVIAPAATAMMNPPSGNGQKFAEVEYLGYNLSIRTWRGRVSGSTYHFAAIDGFRTALVDERDLDPFQGRSEFAVRAVA